VEEWINLNSAPILQCRQILADLKTAGQADFAMLPVAMREIRGMSRSDTAQSSTKKAVTKTAKKPRSKSKARSKTA
jgi:hypothetical protein